MRVLLVALAALAASCSPPVADTMNTPDAVLLALDPVVSASVGQPVTLGEELVKFDGDFAWVVAQPRAPDGEPVNWSTTNFATQASEGMLDGDGVTYALLKRDNGTWRVLEHAIGPTDVAWLDWAERHGAPPTLIETPN